MHAYPPSFPNTIRNRYALTERDDATGLDDTWFRKLENRGGRWTSPDPYNGSANLASGQSWNRYAYVENQPTNYVDPSGLLMIGEPQPQQSRQQSWLEICWLLGICGNPSTGSTGQESSGGGGGSRDECDVAYRVFPHHSYEWTGMVRKTNTQDKHQYATYKTAELIREIGAEWAKSNGTDIRIGDVSLLNGADTPDHKEHQEGDQLDIGLFVTGGANVGGVNYKSSNYDRQSTEKLVNMLQNNPNVTKIIFNDPKIKGRKIARDSDGTHDNHLHVEFDDGCN